MFDKETQITMQSNKLLPILLPCVFFWCNKRIIAGLICLGLQITIIGWILAALWALQVLHKANTSQLEDTQEESE